MSTASLRWFGLRLLVPNPPVDIPPGFPGAELDDAQHLARFRDCLAYAPHPPSDLQANEFLQRLDSLTTITDVRDLLALLTVPHHP